MKLGNSPMRPVTILLASALLVAILPAQGLKFEASKESEHFKIFYHTSYEQQADRLLRAHEDCYAFVTDFIGYKPPSKTEIYLCATPEEIHYDFGYPTIQAVEYSCGQFYRGVLSYYNPRELIQTEGALATHEVTHVVERQFLPFACPFWWSEGLACYLTYKLDGKPSPGGLYHNQLQAVSDSILRTNPPFRTLQDLISPPADDLSYITSMTVFLYLDENFSQSRIKELVQSAKNTGNIYAAFNATLERGFSGFQADWKECLTRGVKAIADAQVAVQAAMLEHRTQGLDNAIMKLSEAINTFNVGKFGDALAKADEASVLAQSCTKPTAHFELSNLTLSPKEGTAGEPVTISVNVSNTGGASGETTVALRINGVAVENRTVTLVPAEMRTVTFVVTQMTEGTYQVNVAGLTGSFTIKSVSQFPTPLVLIALAVILPAYLLLRRSRKKK